MLNISPHAIQQILIVYFISSSVHMLTKTHNLALPPPFPLVTRDLFSISMNLFRVRNSSILSCF